MLSTVLRSFFLIWLSLLPVVTSAGPACEQIFAPSVSLFNDHVFRDLGVTMAESYGVRLQRYAENEYFPPIRIGWFRSKTDPRAKELVDRLLAYGKDFGQLLVDPALVQHREDFFQFMNTHSEFSNDPWAARRAFIESTPLLKIYRAMALTDADLALIDKSGILSNALRNWWGRPRPGNSPNGYQSDRRSALSSHEGSDDDSRRLSPFISVSMYPEVAIAVAQKQQVKLGEHWKQRRYKVYLFEAQLHQAELVNTDLENGLFPPSKMHEEYKDKMVELIAPTGELHLFPPDRRVESFVFSEIPRSTFQWREVTEGLYKWTMVPR